MVVQQHRTPLSSMDELAVTTRTRRGIAQRNTSMQEEDVSAAALVVGKKRKTTSFSDETNNNNHNNENSTVSQINIWRNSISSSVRGSILENRKSAGSCSITSTRTMRSTTRSMNNNQQEESNIIDINYINNNNSTELVPYDARRASAASATTIATRRSREFSELATNLSANGNLSFEEEEEEEEADVDAPSTAIGNLISKMGLPTPGKFAAIQKSVSSLEQAEAKRRRGGRPTTVSSFASDDSLNLSLENPPRSSLSLGGGGGNVIPAGAMEEASIILRDSLDNSGARRSRRILKNNEAVASSVAAAATTTTTTATTISSGSNSDEIRAFLFPQIANRDVHPIFGEKLHSYGYKTIYNADARVICNNIPIWSEQRPCDPHRVEKIANAKMNNPEFQGAISIFSFPQDTPCVDLPQPKAVFDGQHRIKAIHSILQRRPDLHLHILVEVYHVTSRDQIVQLFLEANKSEPVQQIDMPAAIAPPEKRIIDGAVDRIAKTFPACISSSSKCRHPNINVPTLRNRLFLSEYLSRHPVQSEEALFETLMSVNKALSEFDDSEWSDIQQRGLQKARANNFFLGLTTSWIDC